jgi:hypothetical protein
VGEVNPWDIIGWGIIIAFGMMIALVLYGVVTGAADYLREYRQGRK